MRVFFQLIFELSPFFFDYLSKPLRMQLSKTITCFLYFSTFEVVCLSYVYVSI